MGYAQPRSEPAEVVRKPDVMGGWPCVSGTRVPALTIITELRAGSTDTDIFTYYPSLPPDGIKAVKAWARANGISLSPDAAPFKTGEWPPISAS